MHIQFDKIRAKNFGAIGNAFIEIDYRNAGLVLVYGQNGSCKSFMMLDALSYVLFDKAFREVSKTRMINTITKKDMMVELEVWIGKDFYLLRRGMKPSIFEIYKNGILVDQESSNKDYKSNFERILGMNFKTFKQLVVLGSASHKQFMNLPALDRREVVEELLDLQIFTSMNLILKEKMQENIDKFQEIDHLNAINESQIQVIKKQIEKAESINDETEEAHRATIKELESRIIDLKEQFESIVKEIDDTSKINDLENKLKKDLKVLHKTEIELNYKIEQSNKIIDFYNKNSNCPTCKQTILEEFKHQTCEEHGFRLVQYEELIKELIDKIKNVQDRLNKVDEEQTAIQAKLVKKSSITTSLRNAYTELERVNKSILNQKVKENIESQYKDLISLQNSIIDNEKLLESLLEEKRAFSIAARMLKDDGIKAVVIQQYIGIINQLINKHLKQLDFMCQFEIDQNFNETVKSRYRDDFVFNSFSEGEKFRLNISIMLAWRDLAEMRNSVSTNLLIMDEILDSSLDGDGTEEVLRMMGKLKEKVNIFIISHKSDLNLDKFDKTIEFKKHGNFSLMEVK